MKIYVVQYQTGYDYCEILGHYSTEEAANEKCKQVNKDNPGLDAFVSDIDVEE